MSGGHPLGRHAGGPTGKLIRQPPDVLITTPESLYLMLTSKARETLASVEHVIIDEIHAMAATKRGAHLSLSLERLVEIADKPPQRIGLSATQRPLDEIARFLGGSEGGTPRPVTIVDAGVRKELDVEVVVPVEDLGALGEIVEDSNLGPQTAGRSRRSIWPSMHPRLLELIKEHRSTLDARRSTLVFVNSRWLAERLATRLNELEAEGIERARNMAEAGHRVVFASYELSERSLLARLLTTEIGCATVTWTCSSGTNSSLSFAKA